MILDLVFFKLSKEVKSLLSFCNDVLSVSFPLQVIAYVCYKEFERVSGGDGVSICLYGYFWIWHASELIISWVLAVLSRKSLFVNQVTASAPLM